MGRRRIRSRLKGPPYRRTFLREWRQYRERTLEQAAEYAAITHAQLSRIERRLQPYGQRMIESLAEYYGTDVNNLLNRDPQAPEPLWSVLEHAEISPERRRMIEQAVIAMIRAAE